MDKSLVNSNFLWRVAFTFMIVLTHCSYIDRSNTSYYIGVDYFFIISGLMIVYGIDIKGNIKTTFEFTMERIKKLYPHIFLSNTIFFIWVVKNDSFKSIIQCFIGYLYQFIPMMYFVMPDGG